MLFHPHSSKHVKYIESLLLLILLTGIVGIVLNFDSVQTWLTRAQGEPANLIIDTQGITGSLNKPWQSLAQGGESKDYSFTPIVSQLRTLKPQYIRIDHIYDFYDIVSKSTSGELSFDFTQLDRVINEIRQSGALPFISLSYMPPAISQGDVIDPPQNWADWSLTVEKTIEHVSGRSGLNLSGVYYEVWNEPDLFGNWKTYGDKNYLTLYHQAVIGANRARSTNPFFIGGPATTNLYQNWVTKFFDYVSRHQLRVDFYSWHLYSPRIEDYTQALTTYDQLLRQYPEYIFKVEPIITEWGHNSENSSGYDSTFAAAHSVAVVSELLPVMSKAFIFEIQDGKDPNGQTFWGRWGLLSHQDFGSRPKPRFQAIQLLSRLGDQKLSLIGLGTWVKGIAAQSATGATQLLLSNYDPQSRHTETVPITFQRVTPGNFTLTTEYLGRAPTSTTVATTSATLRQSLTLPPNSVVLLTLESATSTQ